MILTEADNLALDLEFARGYLTARRSDRGAFAHYIETNERRLEEMRTPAPKPLPMPAAEPENAGASLDPRETGICGCGRSWPHGGRCQWKRAQEKNGGGQKRKAIARKVGAVEIEEPTSAPVEPQNGLVAAVAADPTAQLTFSVVAIRGEDRVEISGSSPQLFLKVIDLIGGLT